jgi:hypothetical protein
VDSPAGAAPSTNACGTFTPGESAALVAEAKQTLDGKEATP